MMRNSLRLRIILHQIEAIAFYFGAKC